MTERRRAARRRVRTTVDRDPGMYFYVADWTGDKALQRCSDAAIGLWSNLLFGPMFEAVPRGVLPGDWHDVAKLMGAKSDREAAAWVAERRPLLLELEQKKVFYRGATMPGTLAPDAIVNKRMYVEWLANEDFVAHQKAAGKARAKQAARGKRGKFGASSPAGAPAGSPAEPPAGSPAERPAARPAKHPAEQQPETIDCKEVDQPDIEPEVQPNGQPKNSLSLTPTLTLYRSRDHNTCDCDTPLSATTTTQAQADLQPVGHAVLGVMRAIDREPELDGFIASLSRLTGDTNWGATTWRVGIASILRTPAGRREFEDLLERLEKDVDPVKAAGRGNQVIRNAKAFGIFKMKELAEKYSGGAR